MTNYEFKSTLYCNTNTSKGYYVPKKNYSQIFGEGYSVLEDLCQFLKNKKQKKMARLLSPPCNFRKKSFQSKKFIDIFSHNLLQKRQKKHIYLKASHARYFLIFFIFYFLPEIISYSVTISFPITMNDLSENLNK